MSCIFFRLFPNSVTAQNFGASKDKLAYMLVWLHFFFRKIQNKLTETDFIALF